jgi:hypothetical protein
LACFVGRIGMGIVLERQTKLFVLAEAAQTEGIEGKVR